MCRKWGTDLTPSTRSKGTWILTRWTIRTIRSLFPKLDIAQQSFPKSTQKCLALGFVPKIFLTHPKIISSLPERLWSQNINLSFFISVYAEFSPALREEATGFCCKLLCSSHSLPTSVFSRRENTAPHQAGCLRKAGRAKELSNTPRAWSALSPHWSWLASKTHLILFREKAIF